VKNLNNHNRTRRD